MPTLSTQELRHWLAIARIPSVGRSRFLKIQHAFPQLEEVFKATHTQLGALGLPDIAIDALRNPDWAAVERDLRWAENNQHHILALVDVNYPPLLKQISSPPVLLFVQGDPHLLHSLQLAIVGSRNPSASGIDHAYQFSRTLASGGLTITSGLALGVDAKSHQGALDVNGKTVAILGAGLDHIYPRSNKALAEKIAATGALVSEYPLGTTPQAKHFPQRNRIICGLSLGVLVIEATLKSGSLITARLAAEQGREVFAIPGSIHNPLARGCHWLIRQGAKLVETTQDIVEELSALANFVTQPVDIIKEQKPLNNLDKAHQQLFDYIGFETTTVDQLVIRSGLSAQQVAAMLLRLELDGRISSTTGGYERT